MHERPSDERSQISSLRDRPPGDAASDPYADVDLDTLPDWWREAVEEYRRWGLRPYRPPRFADGTLKHEVTDDLERELGVDILFLNDDPLESDEWTVLVDGEPTTTVAFRRHPDGYTLYEVDAGDFESRIRAFVAGRD